MPQEQDALPHSFVLDSRNRTPVGSPCDVMLLLDDAAAAARSCHACSGRAQADRNLADNLLIISGYGAFHVNTSALRACVLSQPLELNLEEVRQLLRGQDDNGDSSGLASCRFDGHGVWGFSLLYFRTHVTLLFLTKSRRTKYVSEPDKSGEKNDSILLLLLAKAPFRLGVTFV